MYYVLATILFNSRLRDIVVLIYVLITIFCISDFNGFYICICLQKRKKVKSKIRNFIVYFPQEISC